MFSFGEYCIVPLYIEILRIPFEVKLKEIFLWTIKYLEPLIDWLVVIRL